MANSELHSTVRLLASSGQDQLDYMRSLGPVLVDNDYLVLDFHEAWLLMDQLVDAGIISQEQSDAVNRINQALDRIDEIKDRDLWDDDAIRSAPEWNAVREAAAKAHALLDDGIDYEAIWDAAREASKAQQ